MAVPTAVDHGGGMTKERREMRPIERNRIHRSSCDQLAVAQGLHRLRTQWLAEDQHARCRRSGLFGIESPVKYRDDVSFTDRPAGA